MSCRFVFEWWVSYPLPPLCGVVLSVRRGTRMVSDQTEVTAVNRSLRGQCDTPTSVRAGILSYAPPLPILPRGRDGGEVVHLQCG
jgi:hypothetical protein